MNDLQSNLPGKLELVLDSLCYNAGAGWQRQVTLWVPLVVMIFLFTESLSRTEARRKGNVICLVQVAFGSALLLLALAQINARLFQSASALGAIGGSVLVLVLSSAAILAPLSMLISGGGYGVMLKAWLTTILVALGLVGVSNIVWQFVKQSEIQVLAVEGKVKYRGSPLQWWSSLSGTNTSLPVGTIFRTGPDDNAVLRLGPATVISIRPDSVISVRQNKGLPVMVIEAGKLIGDVVPGQNERFIIRSPAAISGIIGTRFMVQSDTDRLSVTTVAEGFVRVTGEATDSTEVTVDGGMSTQVRPGHSPESPKTASPKELEEINRVFPQHTGYRR